MYVHKEGIVDSLKCIKILFKRKGTSFNLDFLHILARIMFNFNSFSRGVCTNE